MSDYPNELSKLTTDNWLTDIDLTIHKKFNRTSDFSPTYTLSKSQLEQVNNYLREVGYDPEIIFNSKKEFNKFLIDEMNKTIMLLKNIYHYNKEVFICIYCETLMEYPLANMFPVCPNHCEGFAE